MALKKMKIQVPLNRGFTYTVGDFMPPEGYTTNINMQMSDRGEWLTRIVPTAAPDPGVAAGLTDIHIIRGQTGAYCICNGLFYYNANLSGDSSWTVCTGSALGFTPVSGTWTEATVSGGSLYTIYCDINSAVPIKFNLASPTAYTLLESGIFTANSNISCCTYQNCLLVAGMESNKIYYSDVNSITIPSANTICVGPSTDHIKKLLNVNGSLIVIKESSIYTRSSQNALFDEAQFLEQVNSFSVGYSAHGICIGPGYLCFANQSGVVTFGEGSINNLVHGWNESYPYIVNGSQRLIFWPAGNCLLLYAMGGLVAGGLTMDSAIYDMRKNIWYGMQSGIISADFDNRTGYLYTGDATGKMWKWYPNTLLGDSATLNQLLYVPFFCPGGSKNLIYDMYLRKITIDGYGLSALTIRGKKTFNDTPYTVLSKTGGLTRMSYSATATKALRELDISISATARACVKSITLELEQRRELVA